MKSSFLILLAVGLGFALSTVTQTISAERPNFILMLSDDQGWNGTSVQMHPEFDESRGQIYQTPNLERLAQQGMRFSQAYAPAPVCSPTRISIQTGKSPAQLHWTKAAPPVDGMKLIEPRLIKSISPQEETLAEILKAAGYATAHYGKWHIAGGGPGEHGYDEHDGDTGNENAFKFFDPNPVDIFGMADRAKAFMAKSQSEGKPFFIQLSWNALHAAENASKASLEKYQKLMPGANEKQIAVAAITEDLDRGVGKVIEAVEQLQLADSTYVIYLSDNGAGGGGGVGGKRKGLRGGKGGVWEGGLRVPFIVRGPGVDANSWCSIPIVGYDLLPTLSHLAGVNSIKLSKEIEGGSIHELLHNGGKGNVKRKFDGIAFHFPHYQSEGPQSSWIKDNLKLVHFYEEDSYALFDLNVDLEERVDLSKSRPKDVTEMKAQLDAYLKKVDAQFPTQNPNYDPQSTPRSDNTRGKKGQNKTNKPKGNGKLK